MLKKLIPKFLISWYHWLWAFLSAVLYGFPSRRLKVIGVTGTNGKTTTCFLIAKILEEAGHKVAMSTSVKFKIGREEQKNKLKMTMPGHGFLHKFLRQALKAGCDFAVLEVTSEGIVQHRHQFIDFEAAVFTNLSPEHIERHGGFENYQAAKGKLFQMVKGTHIINVDDENAGYFLQFPAEAKYGYGIKGQELRITPCPPAGRNYELRNIKVVKAENIEITSRGCSFALRDSRFVIRLMGEFNIYNALAAISTGLSFGVPLETCKKALEKVKGMPGRMEKVIASPFEVYVDYAFTPNALQKVYETLSGKSEVRNSKSQMICVLGACGGGRDKWKRPVLGRIAAEHCDKVIITNEDPYDENPGQILSEIKSGISKAQFPMSNFYEILDRRKAIRKALEMARPGDKVVITGKGAEVWMQVAGGKKIPWDDRQVVKEEFRKTIKFEILEHTADLKLRSFGKDKKELFLNTMTGMFKGARYEFSPGSSTIKREIKISSPGLPSLLVNFLSEVLYFCETEKEAYYDIIFKKFSEKKIEGVLIGKKLKRIGVQIKGVTYHDLDMHQKKDRTWQATILFDI